MVDEKGLNDITLCLGCTRKLHDKLVGVANYCCQNCTLDNPCKKPECATVVCKKHGTQMHFHPEEGYGCNQCEREMWDNEANHIIRGFKCPVCLRSVKVEEYDAGYVAFRCEYVFDTDGNFAKPPCPVFRVQLCDECNQASCVCQEYPEHPEQESRF
ncbi:hypothetical protein LCGC14_0176030 [marine sediment metagenome]|uniref:Uncharacterized protein n=1 Tax=marine sediment metagenome TaxID=412755 RepID=A0A0F9UVG5_9ZZZZ